MRPCSSNFMPSAGPIFTSKYPDRVDDLAGRSSLVLSHFVFVFCPQLANCLNVRVFRRCRAHGKLEGSSRSGLEMFLLGRGELRRRLRQPRWFSSKLMNMLSCLSPHQFGGHCRWHRSSDRAIGPHFDHQLFVVGHLAETGRTRRVV